MSMFGNLTAGYIREAIDKEIEDVKLQAKIKLIADPKHLDGIIEGLERAKAIAERYED